MSERDDVDSMAMMRDEVRSNVFATAPHVVLLGAGASKACLDEFGGDRAGKPIPIMNEIPSVIPEVRDLLDRAATAGIEIGDDFEANYSAIHAEPSLAELADELQQHTRHYFAALELPEPATIYDHLLLALRPKDLIASFNWDPLLEQARQRAYGLSANDAGPQVVYLHGNTAIGRCEPCERTWSLTEACPDCEKELTPSPLLFPTPQKDYSLHKSEWDAFTLALHQAKMFTIFGYSAPVSDKAAVDVMRIAWGDIEGKFAEWIELIGRPNATSEDQERTEGSWRSFIPFITHSTHFKSFYDSQLGLYPRRSIEIWFNTHVNPHFVESDPAPRAQDLATTWAWYEELLNYE